MSHWKTDALLLHTVSGLFIVTFLTEGNPGGFTGDSRLLRTLAYANEVGWAALAYSQLTVQATSGNCCRGRYLHRRDRVS